MSKKIRARLISLLISSFMITSCGNASQRAENGAVSQDIVSFEESSDRTSSEDDTDNESSENASDRTSSEDDTDNEPPENTSDITLSEDDTDKTSSENTSDKTSSENTSDITSSEDVADSSSSDSDVYYNKGKDSNDIEDALVITCFKAGAADAFVLESDNYVVMIDTGLDKNKDKIVEFLDEQGITRVDDLIITHFDKDHVGGADAIIEEFDIGNVYVTYQSKDSDDITNYYAALEDKGVTEQVVRQDFSFELDGITYDIYAPWKTEYTDKTSNNSSLVIKVTYGDNSMLFAGDAEEERIEELLETPGLESTILKVPHHGRSKSNFEEFIEYIKPSYAIITSSKSEPEDQDVVDILEDNGCEVYLTRKGTITITMTKDEIGIE